MNKLIIIPARGGSKGIPKKNIYPLNGKPLLLYTLEIIAEAKLEKADIVVSTDSKEIKGIAESVPNVYVVDRPDQISGDNASTEDALIHALHYMENLLNKRYEAVITLQPTSPLRKASTLKDFIEHFENNYPKFDALLSLSEDRTDFWIQENGNFGRLFPMAPRRRQERKPIYKENSAYYITGTQALLETHSVLGRNVNGYVISEIEGIDINEPIDLVIASAFLNEVIS